MAVMLHPSGNILLAPSGLPAIDPACCCATLLVCCTCQHMQDLAVAGTPLTVTFTGAIEAMGTMFVTDNSSCAAWTSPVLDGTFPCDSSSIGVSAYVRCKPGLVDYIEVDADLGVVINCSLINVTLVSFQCDPLRIEFTAEVQLTEPPVSCPACADGETVTIVVEE